MKRLKIKKRAGRKNVFIVGTKTNLPRPSIPLRLFMNVHKPQIVEFVDRVVVD